MPIRRLKVSSQGNVRQSCGLLKTSLIQRVPVSYISLEFWTYFDGSILRGHVGRSKSKHLGQDEELRNLVWTKTMKLSMVFLVSFMSVATFILILLTVCLALVYKLCNTFPQKSEARKNTRTTTTVMTNSKHWHNTTTMTTNQYSIRSDQHFCVTKNNAVGCKYQMIPLTPWKNKKNSRQVMMGKSLL